MTARLLLKASLRDKLALFWAVLFPIALLLGLGIAFPQAAYHENLLAGVLAMSTFFSTLWTIAFESVMLRTQGVYKLLRLTPFRTFRFILELAGAKSVSALLSCVVVYGVGVILWRLETSPLITFLLFFVLPFGTLCFMMLGFLVSNFARDIAQVSLLLNLVGMPLLFLSEAFYSLERAPTWISALSQFLPFQHFVLALQGASNSDFPQALLHTLIVAGFALVFLLATTLTWRWR